MLYTLETSSVHLGDSRFVYPPTWMLMRMTGSRKGEEYDPHHNNALYKVKEKGLTEKQRLSN